MIAGRQDERLRSMQASNGRRSEGRLIMNEFPFSEDEWEAVNVASSAIVNATLAEDAVLRDCQFTELQLILKALTEKHGDHPVLIETEADFTGDAVDRLRLYGLAVSLAETNCLPTYTIRISLAGLLLEEFGELESAREALLACEQEVTACADDYDKKTWEIC